jgi:alkylhydroperoxidase family enzyme
MAIRDAGARQAGLSEEKIMALGDLNSAVFTPRERAALRFAELLTADHQKIDDGLFADLRRHFSEAEIVELGVAAALNLGLGRLTATFGVEPV